MKEKNLILIKTPFAHRGYHSKSIPENSLEAFSKALEKNYAIEMDIHFTKDFNIIVFHDYFLGRLTSKTGFVQSRTLNYIKKAKLFNEEPVPTLEEVLKLVDGRVPLLLEIKFSKHIKRNLEMFEKVLSEKLNKYKGPLAMMSFSLNLMKFLKKNKLLRSFPLGLTTDFPLTESSEKKIKNSKLEKEIVASNLDFISQNWKGIKNLRIGRLRKLDIAILSWTITSRELEKKLRGLVDNITFEHYEPVFSD